MAELKNNHREGSDEEYGKESMENSTKEEQASSQERSSSQSVSAVTSSFSTTSRMKEPEHNPSTERGVHRQPSSSYGYDHIRGYPKQNGQYYRQSLNTPNSSRSTLQHQSPCFASKASRQEWSSSDSSSLIKSSRTAASRMKMFAQSPDEEQIYLRRPTNCSGYDRIYPTLNYVVRCRPLLNSSNTSRSTYQDQYRKPVSKVLPQLSEPQSSRLSEGCPPMKKCSMYSDQGQIFSSSTSTMRYKRNGQMWTDANKFNRNGNYEAYREITHGYRTHGGGQTSSSSPSEMNPFEPIVRTDTYRHMWTGDNKFNRNGEFGASRETNRGPRSRGGTTSLNPQSEKDPFGLTIQRDKYNLQSFQTTYENAKFFVIKSYSEEDIHKSIKYNVWASTPNGNKKLDAAFHDAGNNSGETATKCPIFLFFSVNGSGQFVGLAEMIGQVDFKQDMDFWQQNKWNGFFPLQWHIIKDITNYHLRHIINENNDNKPVTHSRDTQEIGFKQGLEMLAIFKSHPVKTSMLDDYYYYEDQVKLSNGKGRKATASKITSRDEYPDYLEVRINEPEAATQTKRPAHPKTSLITLASLAKNLSLKSDIPKPNDQQ